MAKAAKLTDAQREQRRAQDRERLHQAAQQPLSSKGWHAGFACAAATAYRATRCPTSS